MTKTKKESKKKFLILLLIVLLLALAVGYAAFSDTLEISGTANVKGSFDVQFVSDGCSAVETQGCTATVQVGNQTGGSETNVTDDKLTVTVTDLAYPGAGVHVHAQIKNVGTIPAKITSISTETVPNGNGNAIKVHGLEHLNTSHPTLVANGICDFDFTIMWDPEVTTLNASNAGENMNDNTNKYTFTFVITYEQDTTALNLTGAYQHNDLNNV